MKTFLNAGIGKLIKKWKPTRSRKVGNHRISSNPLFLGLYNASDIEKWANTVDFTYGFHQLHSLILSYGGFYLSRNLFKHCQDNNIEIFYTSTDSIAIRSRDLPKMKAFIGNDCGQFKVEATSDEEGPIYVQKGLYYVSPEKYCCQYLSHDAVCEYCRKNNWTLKQFFTNAIADKGLLLKAYRSKES